MSRLDQLYTLYRRYCAEARHEGTVLSQLIINADGSGCVQTKVYKPTNDNPFNVTTFNEPTFISISNGIVKLKESLDGTNVLPKSRAKAIKRNVAKNTRSK